MPDRTEEARERTASSPKLHKRRREEGVRSAIRYFRTPPWTPEKLMDKAGRLAVRLIALNTVLKEKTGVRMIGPSLESALNTLIYQDIRIKKSRAPTSITKPSTSPPPSSLSSGSADKPDSP